jgi:hypothetical protein
MCVSIHVQRLLLWAGLNKTQIFVTCCSESPNIYFPNGRYTDCLSLPSATNEGKTLQLHNKY